MLERFWCSLVDQLGEPLSVPKLVVKICLRWALLWTQRPRVLKGTVGHSSLQQAAPLPLANEALSLPWAWLQFPCPSINVAACPWTTKLQSCDSDICLQIPCWLWQNYIFQQNTLPLIFSQFGQAVQRPRSWQKLCSSTWWTELTRREITQGRAPSARAEICLLHRKKWKIEFDIGEHERAGLSWSCIARVSLRPSRIRAAADVCPPYPTRPWNVPSA